MAPLVAIGVGVWAEFAELTPPVLFAVSIPVIIVSASSLAYLLQQRMSMVLALVLACALVGVVTFGLAEGTHVAIHLARGKTFELEAVDPQWAKGAFLIGVHVVAGALIGFGVGVGLAVLYAANAWVVRRANLASQD